MTKVVSCRVCFSEEKSVGIRQGKSFAAVMQQLQSMAPYSPSASTQEGEGPEPVTPNPEGQDTVASLLPLLQKDGNPSQQDSTMVILESIVKRLTQVQNWVLRLKEKEVHSLQLHIYRLEQELAEANASVREYKQTVRALRRNIQSDMKIIKTMATQKQQQDEADAAYYREQMLLLQQQHIDVTESKHDGEEKHEPIVEVLPHDQSTGVAAAFQIVDDRMASPSKASTASPDVPSLQRLRSPPQRQPTPHSLQDVNATPDQTPNNSVAVGSPPRLPQRSSLLVHPSSTDSNASNNSASSAKRRVAPRRRSSHIESIPEDEEDGKPGMGATQSFMVMNSEGGRPGVNATPSFMMMSQEGPRRGVQGSQSFMMMNQPYWNDKDVQTMNPAKIFQSFRGGLLDIPKSPPKARHNREDGEGVNKLIRKKLQLDSSDLDALRVPVSRSNSVAVNNRDKAEPEPKKEISLDLLAASLSKIPVSRKIKGHSPEQFFVEKVPSQPGMPTMSPLKTPDGSPVKPSRKQEGETPMTQPISNDQQFLQQSSGMKEEWETPLCDPSFSAPDTVSDIVKKGKRVVVNAAPAAPMFETTADQNVAETPAAAVPTRVASTGSDSSDKFVFSVTGAECHDKFGDEGLYTGEILVTEGLPHGQGKMNYVSGRVYEGEWVVGQWHGKGKLDNPNGDTYEGEFFFDARHGHGVYKWDNGDVYVGSFSSDKRHGKGKFSFQNGNVYEGDFSDGMFEGFGKYTFSGGYYEGDWKEGRYHGAGELTYETGGKYTGEFRNSVAHGFGIEITTDGRKRRGIWTDGEPTELFEMN
jgi:hypothetical protein